jgi:hypothetical protein
MKEISTMISRVILKTLFILLFICVGLLLKEVIREAKFQRYIKKEMKINNEKAEIGLSRGNSVSIDSLIKEK